MTTTDRSVVHDHFVVERTYPAAPERVFAAWTSREAKARWFGPDAEGDVVAEHTLDFRVGGREHMRGQVHDGPSYDFDATFYDIVDGRRIVWSYDMHLDGRRISVSVATVEVTPVAGGTRLVLTEQGAYLDGLDTNDQRRAGTEELLDALGASFDRP
ncbi:Uncharacterized conserved protein YndB, AHSA1/START domain [Jatrophihabitans endophyticus]|uniref:Uncharacterized conserved protein YndB, AHSA1/START domain n=1 Tax=Jatrophihabitans endophyticus TaxID=1206085 RepID=A0A1M5HNH2_9ACTN|nr:SRPBCC family protein [Jatrophihabitans endophyticus]SHG17509.1 Uncharacterized conserved protein YndB, AHSA1/START domain [Jatrophihabitans endophyticus]